MNSEIEALRKEVAELRAMVQKLTPAVDDETGARDVRRRRRRQEHDGTGDVLGLSHPAERTAGLGSAATAGMCQPASPAPAP